MVTQLRSKKTYSRDHKSIFIIILFEVFLSCLLIIGIEGFLSWYHFLKNINTNSYIAEELHTHYDPLLGWINTPNVVIPNMYGPNKRLTINAYGFRATPVNPNTRAIRTICSGDSFTLGYGVDDRSNWCSLLSVDNLQTINMGQGGYGIDQSYLWYLRDAAKLPHTFHIIAVIPGDFDRTTSNTFLGYGKPFFQMKGNVLTNVNYPVPKPQQWLRFISTKQNAISQLNIVQTASHIKNIMLKYMHLNTNSNADDAKADIIISAIFDNMIRITKERGAIPIIVLLPTRFAGDDFRDHMEQYNKKEELLSRISTENNINFIDIEKSLFSVDKATYETFFIPTEQGRYFGEVGHLTEAGNAYVAEKISSVINQYIYDHPEILDHN